MIESLRSCLAPSETWPATIEEQRSTSTSRLTSTLRLTLLLATLPLLLSSCHKNCVCQGYDGSSYTYTSDEVDARNVTCSNMVFQAGQQFYAVCEWE